MIGSSAGRVSTCQPNGHSSSRPKVWSFLFDVKCTRFISDRNALVSGSDAGPAPW